MFIHWRTKAEEITGTSQELSINGYIIKLKSNKIGTNKQFNDRDSFTKSEKFWFCVDYLKKIIFQDMILKSMYL